MNTEMKQKLQSVLDRVKEPESGRSLSDIGLVNRIRYNESHKKLIVILNPLKPGKLCCAILSGLLLNTTKRDLVTELEKEFSDLSVEFF